jgi:hypothetical protein
MTRRSQVSRASRVAFGKQATMPARKPGRGAGVDAAPSGEIPASALAKRSPRDNQNYKLTLKDVTEIRRLRPTMVLRELAKQFGVSLSAISAVCQGHSSAGVGSGPVGGPVRRGPKPARRWGKRYSNCIYCRGPIPVQGQATRGVCPTCMNRAFKTITIYDRDAQIGEIPEALRRRYSLSG